MTTVIPESNEVMRSLTTDLIKLCRKAYQKDDGTIPDEEADEVVKYFEALEALIYTDSGQSRVFRVTHMLFHDMVDPVHEVLDIEEHPTMKVSLISLDTEGDDLVAYALQKFATEILHYRCSGAEDVFLDLYDSSDKYLSEVQQFLHFVLCMYAGVASGDMAFEDADD